MKSTILGLAVATLIFSSCKDAPKADEAQTGAATEMSTLVGAAYNADLSESHVTWIGTKPVGQHHGKMTLENGLLAVEDGQITGGKFDIAVTSLQSLDEDTSGSAKLMGHLKSGDFFEVEKFPLANFEITAVKEGLDEEMSKDLVMQDATHTVTGNLTLKGVKKGISFPAKIAMNENTVTTDANFNINRTDWGLSYGNDESLKDKFIRPTVNIGLHIVAKKG